MYLINTVERIYRKKHYINEINTFKNWSKKKIGNQIKPCLKWRQGIFMAKLSDTLFCEKLHSFLKTNFDFHILSD